MAPTTPASALPGRRAFLVRSAAAALAFPAVVRSRAAGESSQKLRIACVGVGGRGRAAVDALAGEHLAAFCDVDDARASGTYQAFPDVPRFRDYREMLDRMASTIDAVTVSTPDHMHFPVAVAALRLGKHVFVEKPLAHTVEEARLLTRLAKERGVATQMGIQGHAAEGMRLLREWHEAGMLGEVREIHSWTDRPIWPQGIGPFDHSQRRPVVPSTLDWELWQGVAPARAYDPGFAPFKWRGFWDYGTGALGDMGCHMMDGAFWALDLGAPSWVEASGANTNDFSAPTASIVTYDFPATARRPGVRWLWYDGGLRPPLPAAVEPGRTLPENATLIVGTRAAVLADANYFTVRLVPEVAMQAAAGTLPPRRLPRVPGGNHFAEWVAACKGGPAAGAAFEYSGPLTEMVLLGNVALRAGRRIVWDAAALAVSNLPSANVLLKKSYRSGYEIPAG